MPKECGWPAKPAVTPGVVARCTVATIPITLSATLSPPQPRARKPVLTVVFALRSPSWIRRGRSHCSDIMQRFSIAGGESTRLPDPTGPPPPQQALKRITRRVSPSSFGGRRQSTTSFDRGHKIRFHGVTVYLTNHAAVFEMMPTNNPR